MTSSFTWLDYSENERRRVLDVIKLFEDKGTRDELGIGTIRDALSDTLFPGISTIQTRAKYFLFVPWMYQILENRKTKSSEIGRVARQHEINLIYQLIEQNDNSGVIGKDAKDRLQRLPSSVYWVGLGVFGIRQFEGSIEQYHHSLDQYYRARRRVHASAEDGIAEISRQQLNWHSQLPPVPDRFPKKTSLSLNQYEAEYLQYQIRTNVPGTYLAFLVDKGKSWKRSEFPWLHPQLTELTDEIMLQLKHAKLFSIIMRGAALLYNLMLAEKYSSIDALETNKSYDWVDHYRNELKNWFEQVNEQRQEFEPWSNQLDDFWNVIGQANQSVSIPTQRFVKVWINHAVNVRDLHGIIDYPHTRDIIRQREKDLKKNLARLENARALELWNGEAGTSQLSFRWVQAQSISLDILQGIDRRNK